MARYALVIGISKYQSKNFSNLSKTSTDAEAVAQILEQYGNFDSVERLPKRWNPEKPSQSKYEVSDDAVSSDQIRQAIKTLLLEKAT